MNNRLCPWLRFSDSTKSNPLRAYDNSMRPLIDYIDLLNLLIQIHLINVLENFMMNSFVVVNIHVTDIFLHSLVPLYWCCGWYGWCGCVYAWLSIGCITYSIWNKHWNLKLFHVKTTKKTIKSHRRVEVSTCWKRTAIHTCAHSHTHRPPDGWMVKLQWKWNEMENIFQSDIVRYDGDATTVWHFNPHLEFKTQCIL